MFETNPDFGHLKKLWTLKLVVESKSLKRAATRSRVSISAVSQCLGSLEKSLGRKLILRRDRELEPTQFCRQLLASAEPAFRACQELGPGLSGTPAPVPMAWLDFGACDSIAPDLFPALTRSLRAKLPRIRLTLRTGRSRELTALVKKGLLCMALVEDSELTKGTSSFPVFEDRLGVFRVNDGKSPSLESVREEGIASITPEADGHPLYYSSFHRAISPGFRPSLSSNSYETLFSVALSGSIAAILPQRLARRARGALVEVPLPAGGNPRAGHFRVSMISQCECDPAEDEFLLSELKSLL